MKFLKIILFCILVLSFFLKAAESKITDAGEYLEKNVVQKTMKNGIKVLMLNRGYSPTVALLISFRVGSVDESYRSIGAAHMLEHMLFKGTEKIGSKDYNKEKKILRKIEKIGDRIIKVRLRNSEDKEIDNLKAQLIKLQKEHRKYVISSPYSRIYTKSGAVGFNASTSRDRTTYYIELPASKLELWSRLESERIKNPVLREFYLEKGAVLEERLTRYESQGSGNLFEKFSATAFLAHPYRHPTIGWKSNIENFFIKDIKMFYEKNYIPSRMTITIVGKHVANDTYELLEKYFGDIQKREEPDEIAIREPDQKGERRFDINFESSPLLIIGWHKPTFPSRVDYIFDIISSILSDGKTSRLYRNLVIEKGLSASINSWNGYPGTRYDNLFTIYAEPKYPATPEEVEEAIYREVEKLKDNLSEAEIKKVITRLESSFIFDLDNNMGIARLLSYYQTVFSDWKYAVNYLKIIKTIKPDEIKEVMETYIKKENRTVGILRNSRKVK